MIKNNWVKGERWSYTFATFACFKLLYKGRQEGCVLTLQRRLCGVYLAHTSGITSKRCIQPHGECGRVDRWPSALGWWCRRRRACHSSCNWGGMPSLAGPFHLRPAVKMKNTKDPGVNYVPPWLLVCCVGLESPPAVIFIISETSAHKPPPTHAPHQFL